jgi:hypothetical protein
MKKKVTFAVTLGVLIGVAVRFLHRDEGDVFESIKMGETVGRVYELLGQPSDVHKFENSFGSFQDLRYWVRYKDRGYSILGVSLGLPRIIRIKDGVVVSKGLNEAYYDAYQPGWVPLEVPTEGLTTNETSNTPKAEP